MDGTSTNEELLQRFLQIRAVILGYLRVLVRDPFLAEDLFQETYLVVSKKLDTFDRSGNFDAWVRGIARNLANNARTNITSVVLPLTIVSDLSSQTVTNGETTSFTVGASGNPSPPIGYQWFFNQSAIVGATDATLTLTNVSSAQAGSYFVYVYQSFGPEQILEAHSQTAILTVQ